jgi:uncharacterized protein (DUF2141 family)
MRMATAMLLALAPFGAAQAATVIVTIEGVEAESGTINVGLCDKSLSREGCPHQAERPATRGTVEVRFEKVMPGRYAVVSYHDLNENNEFDRFFGFPQEPYGLSNNAGESLVPTFDQAALAVGDGETRIRIKLQRFLKR